MPVETSIVVRTLNEAKNLEKLMSGIQRQNYLDWEIVLVDSGSTDGTLDIAERFGANIYHIPQNEFTFGRSLNVGCRNARGKYLVFASGHVWPITNNWLRNLIEPFQEPSVAMVYGRQRGTDASRLSELRDLHSQFGSSSNILVDEPKGNNGNAAVRRDLWLDQPFDESLPGLEDIDWAQKIETKGYRVYYAADAAVYHLHEETLRQVYRRHYREAVASKRMFPHNKFTWWDMIRSLPYFVLRDLLYAARVKQPGKFLQIPGSRLAQFIGLRRGFGYQSHQSKGLIRQLEIPGTSQTVVVDGPGRHSLKERGVSGLQAHEVLIKVAFVQVCGADLALASGRSQPNHTNEPLYPLVPGHAFSGIVLKKGAKVGHLSNGDKVTGEYSSGCGLCPACTGGNQRACTNGRSPGIDPMDGAYADYLVKDAAYVHKLPSDVPLKYGASIESVTVCLSALSRLAPEHGQRACLIGAGPMSNLCAQILKAWGLQVTVVDSNPRWLSLLYRYEVDTLTKLGPLDEYDYLIDSSGDPEMRQRLLNGSKSGVKLLLLNPPCVTFGEFGPAGSSPDGRLISAPEGTQPQDWTQAIKLVQKGIVRLDDHASMVEPLKAYPDAWERLQSRKYFNVLLRVSDQMENL